MAFLEKCSEEKIRRKKGENLAEQIRILTIIYEH